jgi:uncharacterized protein (TIGR02145 family)
MKRIKMKMKNEFRIYMLIVLGLGFILINSCKKVNDNPFTVFDIDGNGYHTVTIGDQLWLKENLKTTKFQNGDLIGSTTPAGLDITAEPTPIYQWAYSGIESNAPIYGRLYTGYAVQDARGLCPAGWHVTNEADYASMNSLLGGDAQATIKIKEAGTVHWNSPNTGTNESGFTALPGGVHHYNGLFFGIGTSSYFWTSTGYSTTTAYTFFIDSGVLTLDTADDRYGLSVRCVKN